MYELLIVDDETYFVESLATTYPWEELGIQSIHTAYSADEALELLERHNIHIMITDIRMPGMDGLELIAHVRRLSPRTKRILLSGFSDFQYAQQAITSQAEAYLLKPVKEDELLQTVRTVIANIETEWNEIVSHSRTLYTLREHLPLLRGVLLNDLLQGKHIPMTSLIKKLETLELKLELNERFAMMFVRMEEGFDKYDDYSRSLLEFGICNIADEIFGEQFRLWQCKDAHENLVFMITELIRDPATEEDSQHTRNLLEKCSIQLQESVAAYLKGGISVLISEWGRFPEDLPVYYSRSMSVLRSHPDHVKGFFMNTLFNSQQQEGIRPLRSLQEPPFLWNLLEAGRWEAAEQKLTGIIEELQATTGYVQ